jgi:hypothetical protein
MRALLDAPSQFVWLQGNTTKGGEHISATLDMSRDQAERLRAALGPRLAGR